MNTASTAYRLVRLRGTRGARTACQRTRMASRVAMAIGLVVATAASGASAGQFGEWSAAVNAESIAGTSEHLNTGSLEGCPITTRDGKELYFASNRPGGEGGLDIWVARRASTTAPWGDPENVGQPINSAYDDFCPSPMRGKQFFFISTRPGPCGGADIYLTRPHPVTGWLEPQNLGCEVNSSAGEASPAYFEDDQGQAVLYFSSNRRGGFAPDDPESPADSDIYMSIRAADGTFGPAVLAEGLNTAADDARPNVWRNGREIVFDSNRVVPGAMGGFDIYAATRTSTDAAWSPPHNLGAAINSAAGETRPSLSWDGKTLYFGSNRVGSEVDALGNPSSDIYVSSRTRTTGRR